MIELVLAPTGLEVTVKVPVEAPAGIVIEAGTPVEVVEEVRVTVTPPAGTTSFIVTVAVCERPPRNVDGLTVTDLGKAGGGVRVRFAEAVPPLN